jgi:hypothetical protein
MKFFKKFATLVLTLGIIGAASVTIFSQPGAQADDHAATNKTQQTAPAPSMDNQIDPVASNTYTNKAMGFSLHLPDSWKNKYEAKEVEKNTDGFPAVVFSNPQHSFELMQIVKIPAQTWKAEGYDDSLYLKLTERNGTVYAALFPSETLYVGDREVTEITDMLNNMFEQIKSSFEIIE